MHVVRSIAGGNNYFYRMQASDYCGFSLAELVNYLSRLLQRCLGKLCLWFICSYVSSGDLPVAAVEKQFQRHFVSLGHWFSADQGTSLHNATNLRYASAASGREQSIEGDLLIVWDCCCFLFFSDT